MKVRQVKELDGAMTCILNHEVKSTTVDFEWTGPKITKEVWDEVLSFFRWSYEVTKGETQVRLYVNTITRTWKAWAYPQKGKTGMTTRELEAPWGPEQFVFNDAEGWLLYGTAHHHCSASAFQSATDRENEELQDGLHITVGHLGRDQYDIDARLYQSGYKLVDFDLADFWEIKTDINSLPKHLRMMIPESNMKLIAKQEMGIPPEAECPFPEQWKTNVVIEPEPVKAVVATNGYYNSGAGGWKRRTFVERSEKELPYDVGRCLTSIQELIQGQVVNDPKDRIGFVDVIKIIEEIDALLSGWHLNLIDIMCINDTRPEVLLAHVRAELKKLQDASKNHNKNGKSKGKGKTIDERIAEEQELAAEIEKGQGDMDFEGSNWRGQGSGLGG